MGTRLYERAVYVDRHPRERMMTRENESTKLCTALKDTKIAIEATLYLLDSKRHYCINWGILGEGARGLFYFFGSVGIVWCDNDDV